RLGGAVADVGDIAQPHDALARARHHELRELLRIARPRRQPDRALGRALGEPPDRRREVLGLEHAHHVGDAEPGRRERVGRDVDRMRLMPLIDCTASSIGSATSRSTTAGDAPGYGIATETTGGVTSGNSSVLSCHSAATPNTTSAIITTVVTTGLLIAKSEIS